jgi:hypothetical protein
MVFKFRLFIALNFLSISLTRIYPFIPREKKKKKNRGEKKVKENHNLKSPLTFSHPTKTCVSPCASPISPPFAAAEALIPATRSAKPIFSARLRSVHNS